VEFSKNMIKTLKTFKNGKFGHFHQNHVLCKNRSDWPILPTKENKFQKNFNGEGCSKGGKKDTRPSCSLLAKWQTQRLDQMKMGGDEQNSLDYVMLRTVLLQSVRFENSLHKHPGSLKFGIKSGTRRKPRKWCSISEGNS
jgi:hypothetical protein